MSARVFLPGWVDQPWTYVAGSAVHVVPAREEAWSQSAVLGLGLGVPVVGTHVDGLVDTLSHSRGVTVAPYDPLARTADFYLAEYQAMLTLNARALAAGLGHTA